MSDLYGSHTSRSEAESTYVGFRGAPPPLNPHKDGDYYDSCPVCGKDADHNFKAGGKDSRGEEYRDWATFHCDETTGGCGYNWSRTTKQGAARLKGVAPIGLTHSAEVNATTFVPSPEYRSNYERIFGHG